MIQRLLQFASDHIHKRSPQEVEVSVQAANQLQDTYGLDVVDELRRLVEFSYKRSLLKGGLR